MRASVARSVGLPLSKNLLSFDMMRITAKHCLAALLTTVVMLTGNEAVACSLCFCLDNSPNESCVNGYCYLYRSTAYCNCYRGYMGNRCHLPVPTQINSPCEPNPCKNHGYCQEYQGGALCTCVTGFTGVFCESTTDASPCDDAVCLAEQTCVALQLGYICV
ncbi:neurogenic locus notch homolog protein 1-like isoform X1 [Patiria miniata]|uniref:EGF-like domain-containing protein n=1 Tax=Patiria miniata TaxID=46514 RepID=A0A914B3T8_PATMI|nr:neurogenic locus notch homolog protein 1-like isoform X1 [Patiria miniata]